MNYDIEWQGAAIVMIKHWNALHTGSILLLSCCGGGLVWLYVLMDVLKLVTMQSELSRWHGQRNSADDLGLQHL